MTHSETMTIDGAENPLISVVIPAYNAAAFVAEAVRSAIAQTYSPVEVIVVDDGSTDATKEALAGYVDQIRYLHQENRGLAGARNTGIRAARGEWIALLDADDQWHPEKLERSLRALVDHPSAALVHTDVEYFDDATGAFVERAVDRGIHQGDCYLKLFRSNAVLPSTVVMRREIVAQLGGFDESLRRVEDWELWLRIARNHPFAFVAQPLTRYRVHGASLSTNFVKMREAELFVVRKTLAADPTLADRIGVDEVRKKLFALNFGIGYHYFQNGHYAEARQHLGEALALRPISLYTRVIWLATWFPAGIIEPMRRLKQLCGSRWAKVEDE